MSAAFGLSLAGGLALAGLALDARAACHLPRVPEQRTFELHVNETCVIERRLYRGELAPGPMKLIVRPKLGVFGANGASSFAYAAGPKPGSDYFEYETTSQTNGGPVRFVIKNYVTIRP